MHRLAWFIGITALCSACTDRKYMLVELPDVDVRVSAAHPVDEQSGPQALSHVIVDLDYDTDKFRQTHDADCAVLDPIDGAYATLDDEHATSATFDDLYMTLTDPGGADDAGNCRPPRFELDVQLGFGREVDLSVGDGRATIRASFYGAFLSPRYATLRSHDSWTFAGGDLVTLEWSHVADAPGDFEVWLEGTESTLLATIHPVDTELAIPIPTPPPVSGDVIVHIIGGTYPQSGGASYCSGAATCRWTIPDGYRHQVTIE